MQRTQLTKLFNISRQQVWKIQGNQSKFFSSLPRSCLLVRSGQMTAPCFSTSGKGVQLNNGNLQNKFIQYPAKLFTRRADEETLKFEDLGWAGQPIFKRLHTIMPEIHGDTSDIMKFAKKSKSILEVGSNLEVQMRNFGRSHDIISVDNEIPKTQNKLNKFMSTDWTEKRRVHTRRGKNYLYNSGILTKNMKVKKKKRTVIVASKPRDINGRVITKYKSPKSVKRLVMNKAPKNTLTLTINRRFSTMPLSGSFSLITKRQFQTYSSLGYPKAAIAVPEEGCVCPEILYTTGKRKSTKICGEAKDAGKEKKKSAWKQKMCPADPEERPEQNRTLVCLSEAAKMGKRKKVEIECPKPEKKVAPRVLICPPNLEEEDEKKMGKEKCVQIEEIKVRKRTQVCKPVVIFAKEEIGVQVEKKAVCVSSRAKKVISKHTKICPPPDIKKM